MPTLDQADAFLSRALQEDRAAERATSPEARRSHRQLASHLREAITRIGVTGDDVLR